MIVEVELALALAGLGYRDERVQQLIGLLLPALYLCAFDAGQHDQSIELTDHAVVPHLGVGNSLNLVQSLYVLLQLTLVGADVRIYTVNLQFEHLLLGEELGVCLEDFLQPG